MLRGRLWSGLWTAGCLMHLVGGCGRHHTTRSGTMQPRCNCHRLSAAADRRWLMKTSMLAKNSPIIASADKRRQSQFVPCRLQHYSQSQQRAPGQRRSSQPGHTGDPGSRPEEPRQPGMRLFVFPRVGCTPAGHNRRALLSFVMKALRCPALLRV